MLENTAHLLVFLLALDQHLRLLRDVATAAPAAPRRFVVLCALLSLNVWCRLDAAAVSAVLGLHAAWNVARARLFPVRGRAAWIAGGAGLCVAAAAAQLIGFRLMGGSYVPVSGLWKTGAPALGEIPALLLQWWGRPLAQAFPFDALAGEAVVHGLACALAIAVPAWAVWSRRRRNVEARAIDAGLVAAIAALALHAACMLALVDAVALRRGVWYQAPHLALMALLLTAAALPSAGVAPAPARRWLRAARAVVVVAALAGLGWSAFDGPRSYAARRQGRTNFHGQRLELARWIDANLPPGARLAAFNSGELGYFSGRPVTNLDGLINSYAYREYRRNGGTVADYLVRDGIDYFVDYRADEAIERVTELVHTQPLPKGEPIEVRRVRRDAGAGK